MQLTDFDYELPESFIAQHPADPRDSSRLMVLDRASGTLEHRIFREITAYLRPGDVLVLNSTRVIPARLPALKASGGAAEVLLLRQTDSTRWRALVGGKRISTGVTLTFPGAALTATVIAELEDSERELEFSAPLTAEVLAQIGQTPLPPYIHAPLADPERYQTVYGRAEGSAAAPTAGLHFTPELLIAVRDMGVKLAYCTLHIGLDTFQPVRAENITAHKIHSERAVLNGDNARIINETRLAGGRVIAVGTTSARTLETAAILSAGGDPCDPAALGEMCAWRPVIAFDADTSLFIYPGYRWRVVDAMITNFHLPKSSLLMMLSSFAGRDRMLHAYETAKAHQYRFFSFGDAMLVV